MPVISSTYSTTTGSSYTSPSLRANFKNYDISTGTYLRASYRHELPPSSSRSTYYRRESTANDDAKTSSSTAVTRLGASRYTSLNNTNNNNNSTSDYTSRYQSRSENRTRDSDNNYTYSYHTTPRSSSLASRAAPSISGADFYQKYRVSNYSSSYSAPKIEVTRSRSLSETAKVTRDNSSPLKSSLAAAATATSKIRASATIRNNVLAPTTSVAGRSWDSREREYNSSSSYRSNSATRKANDATNDDKSDSSSNSANEKENGEKKTSDKTEGLCGLWNIGNTCFMNSVIQCLSHTSELTKYLKLQSTTPRGNGKDHRILSEYIKLINDMWVPGARSVNPTELKYAFSSKHRMYSGSAQQDAQEFLRFFLDSLHSALNTAIKPERVKLDDDLSNTEKADKMWDWYSKAENSIVKDLFVGQLRSTLKCTVCGNASVTFDPFWDLSLPLPSSPSKIKLENCLELFIKEEVLDGDEMPTCSKCKARRKSTKSLTIQRFPKYLVIHLKRFSETRWSKLTNMVEFPTSSELNLNPFASDSGSTSAKYTLYGISNHMGSTAGGHYIAVCKHPFTNKWHEFNDNFVSDASDSSLVSSSAYLLFYERA